MPDFNKGDFTQQGVAGHVNANLRLNEKRLVSLDLTSNEEAEGCTITGTVKDLLNDKVYGIGSGVSGNIEITENGENINVAPYATATVNVSGGGGVTLNYCEITLVNNSASNEYCPVSVIDNGLIAKSITVPANSSLTVISPYLYFGEEGTLVDLETDRYDNFALSSAVNCEVNSDFGTLSPIDNTVNSSCTVTFTGIDK